MGSGPEGSGWVGYEVIMFMIAVIMRATGGLGDAILSERTRWSQARGSSNAYGSPVVVPSILFTPKALLQGVQGLHAVHPLSPIITFSGHIIHIIHTNVRTYFRISLERFASV